MTPSLFLLDETRAWLRRAAEDLAAAGALTVPSRYEEPCFLVSLPAGRREVSQGLSDLASEAVPENA